MQANTFGNKLTMISSLKLCDTQICDLGKNLFKLNVHHKFLSNSVKPFEEMPRQKGIRGSFLGLVLDGGSRYLHLHCDKLHKTLGPIYRDKVGPRDLIFVSDADLIRKVSASDNKYPRQNVPEAWKVFNQVHNVKRGLFFQSGEEWYRLRKPMEKVLLSDIDYIKKFDESINQVTQDLFGQWKKSGTVRVDDLKMHLCKWSIETTGMMLFGNRMGCINNVSSTSHNSKAEEFVNCIAQMFDETSNFQIIPAEFAQKLRLKTWKKFELASKRMLELADEFSKTNIELLLKEDQRPDSLCLVKKLLSFLSPEEVSRSVIDLIIAGADTSSNSLQWMLHLLGNNRDIQTKLREKLNEETGNLFLTSKQVDNVPFLKYFVKEVMRLYPTAPFIARTLDTSIELGGYKIPEEKTIIFSLYTSGRSPQYFHEPLKILPERWQRRGEPMHCPMSPKANLTHAYATLPFGIGVRACIGKRLAELQIHLLVSAFLKNFRLSVPEAQQNLGVKLDMILVPEKPISLILDPHEPASPD